MKKIFLTLLSLAALMVCAKTIIMKVEMKDGNVRYIDIYRHRGRRRVQFHAAR